MESGGTIAMNYDSIFSLALNSIKDEGRYRVFMDIERKNGEFPSATWHSEDGVKDIVVWCSNDYLGMGQHPDVTKAMKDAIDKVGVIC